MIATIKRTRNMKKLTTALCLMVIAATTLIGCSQEHTTYNGGNYIMFADSMNVLPVQNDTELFDITIAATQVTNYDRNVGVEILANKTNAVEGLHYAVESQTVTIKAGSLTGSFKVRGISENIGVSDSLGLTLRLINRQTDGWDIYGNNGQEANVILRKACPFNLDTFEGYCTLTSTYFYDYMPSTTLRLFTSEIDPENENTIILKDFFYKGYDIRVRLDNSNLLTPNVYMDEHQQVGYTGEAFGTIYGDGKLMTYLPSMYTSYFSSCEEFMVLYSQFYVENVGTVGTYMNVIKWITKEEYDVYKKLGY